MEIKSDKKLKLYESSNGVWHIIVLNKKDNTILVSSDSNFIENEVKENYNILMDMFKLEKSDDFGVQLQTLKNFRVLVPGKKDIIKKLEITKDYFTVTRTNGEETFSLSDFESRSEYVEALDDIISEIKDTYAPISYSNIIDSGIIQDKTYKKGLGEKISDASLKVKMGISNLKINYKKIVSIGTAVALVGVGSYGIYKLGQNSQKSTPDSSIEDNYQEDPNNSFIEFEPNYEQPAPNPDEVNSMEVINNAGEITPVEAPADMDQFFYESEDSAINIANNLHDSVNERPSESVLTHYEELVTDNPYEKAYVQYFSDLFNDLTTSYQTSTDDKTAKEQLDANIIDANKEVVRCVLEDESVVCLVDGDYYDIRFSELSPYSQELVLQAAQNIYLLLLDKTFEYNGITYDNDTLSSLLLETYENVEARTR